MLLMLLPGFWSYKCVWPGKDDITEWHSHHMSHTVVWQLGLICSSDVECFGYHVSNMVFNYSQLCPLRIQSGDEVLIRPPTNGSAYPMILANVTQ